MYHVYKYFAAMFIIFLTVYGKWGWARFVIVVFEDRRNRGAHLCQHQL